MPSFFSRVTRYQPGPHTDPRENRLTEAFAATLQQVEGLPHSLVGLWLGVAPDRELSLEVATQVPTAGGSRVDLELRFRNRDGSVLVCWIEIKHGAHLHGDQLNAYLKDLAIEAGGQKRVVLLVPRDRVPEGIPPEIRAARWDTVAAEIRRWLKVAKLDDVESWLLREFYTYLKEEGLTNDLVITTPHVMFLQLEPDAKRTLTRLHELAHESIERVWGERSGPKDRTTNWWSNYAIAARGNKGGWEPSAHFEFTLRPDPRRDADDVHIYAAGATFRRADAPHRHGVSGAWLEERRAEGFDYFKDGGYQRLWRFMLPQVLLTATALPEQARLLSDWVLEAFQALADAPPRFE